jgi:hypothetical protein
MRDYQVNAGIFVGSGPGLNFCDTYICTITWAPSPLRECQPHPKRTHGGWMTWGNWRDDLEMMHQLAGELQEDRRQGVAHEGLFIGTAGATCADQRYRHGEQRARSPVCPRILAQRLRLALKGPSTTRPG